MNLDHLTALQVVALCILVGVLAYGLTHHWFGKKADAALSAAKAEFQRIEKRAEDYTDDELVKLSTTFFERLSQTADQVKVKADADAVLARRAALLAKVQAVAAAAKPEA